jgi:PAS domain S-box-containing protein
VIAAPTGKSRSSGLLFRSIIAVTVLLAALYGVLVVFWGRGPVIFEAPWYIMGTTCFIALAVFTSAFLALGRYQVLRDPASYWIGISCFVTGGSAIFYVLAWPGFSPTGQAVIARLPSTPMYMSRSVAYFTAATMLAAVISPWPGARSLSGRRWIWSIAGLYSLTVLAFVLVVVFEDHLPVLILANGSYSPIVRACDSIALLLGGVTVVLSTRRYLRTGDTLLGYVALSQVMFVFTVPFTLLGARLYDLGFFLGRFLVVSGTVTTMFGLLSEYVKLFRQELRRQQGQLQTLLVNLPDIISHWDRTLRYTSISPNVEQLVGVSPAQLIGRTPRETGLFSEETLEAWEASSRKVLETGRIETMEFSTAGPSGTFSFYLRIVPEFDASGRVVSLIGITQDITERRQLEQRLLRAQRMEAAGRVAAQVAHDFNNLLGPIVAYPDLIRLRVPQDERILEFCDSMQEAALRMAGINENMMTLGRRGLIHQEPIDLNTLVRDALGHLQALPETLSLSVQLDPDLLPVRGDPSQLLTALDNLLRNARESMQDEGVLKVRTESIHLDQPLEGYGRIAAGEYVCLTIADTGHGIPPEIRQKIFDPFFSTRHSDGRRGSGLGLSIVQAIVSDHLGSIDLETEVGKGTSFAIYLPVCRDAVKAAPEQRVQSGTEKVLVVDDDRLQREVAGELLRKLGYDVATAASGEDAVAYVQEQPVDLVVLDMVMPPWIDGAESYRLMSEIRPGQRAILVSGFAPSDRVEQAQALGAGTYVRKPVTIAKLAGAMREELDKKIGDYRS